MWSLSVVVVALAFSYVHSSSHHSIDVANGDYQDDMTQELYKRLLQMDQGYDRGYFDDTDEERNELARVAFQPASDYPDSNVITQEARSPGQTDIRDSEYLAHGPNQADGYIYISGGAGEGKQRLTPEGYFKNIEQVKSDESLPFYCRPPNPCPKGYTSKDGCQDFIEDTVEFQQEWIERMLRKGLCPCDKEHSFNCPQVESMVNDVTDDNYESRRLDEVLNNLLGDKSMNPYAGGQKRQSLVAKKSPKVKRSTTDDKMASELEKLAHAKRDHNPYLNGEKLRTVAKKGNIKT